MSVGLANLVKSPEVCGGRLRIEGTRVTVNQIVSLYKRGMNAEEIADEYPQLNLAQVYTALAYYHSHREEVEAEILAEETDAEKLEKEFKKS
jgi:uncharacterized protein (DUF433 family)